MPSWATHQHWMGFIVQCWILCVLCERAFRVHHDKCKQCQYVQLEIKGTAGNLLGHANTRILQGNLFCQKNIQSSIQFIGVCETDRAELLFQQSFIQPLPWLTLPFSYERKFLHGPVDSLLQNTVHRKPIVQNMRLQNLSNDCYKNHHNIGCCSKRNSKCQDGRDRRYGQNANAKKATYLCKWYMVEVARRQCLMHRDGQR